MSVTTYETTRSTIVRRANGHAANAASSIDTRQPKLEILGSGQYVLLDGVMPKEMAKTLLAVFNSLKR